MRKSSTLNAGQTRSNIHIEYFGEGAMMELRSNQMQKKVIDCAALPNAFPYLLSESETQWYFADLCNNHLDIDFETRNYKDILSWCISILELSPSAHLMLKEANEKDWQITLEDLHGGDYCIDVEQKLLILDNNALDPITLGRSNYFKNVTLVTMIKALRDIWQEKRHGGFDELYSPEHILLMERVRAADLDVVSILTVWELRSEEYSDIWRHMIGSEVGDMAMAFSGYIERDPSSLYNGQALNSTFKQWFRCSKRIDACDHDILEYLDDVLTISDVENPFGKKKPAKLNLEILSCLPDKTAYLQGFGAEILSNPIFSSVDNVINQTHLFHIMYDLEAIIIENVPFRDKTLARKIFPVED